MSDNDLAENRLVSIEVRSNRRRLYFTYANVSTVYTWPSSGY